MKVRSNSVKARSKVKRGKYTKPQQRRFLKMGPKCELGPLYRASRLFIGFEKVMFFKNLTSNYLKNKNKFTHLISKCGQGVDILPRYYLCDIQNLIQSYEIQ